MIKIPEFLGLIVFLFCIVMCNTNHKKKERALFLKICKIDSNQSLSCDVYFFRKVNQKYSIDIDSALIDSIIRDKNLNFFGESLENSSSLHYIDKDTINLFIYEPDS